jgi:asparagine synthase (glutamine-hydrolysing)
MCGIVGILAALPGEELEHRARRMLERIQHRGPDGDGTWKPPEGGLILGHQRLAIIDPQGGTQPLSNPDHSLVVSFNGCIYNFQELRAELKAEGFHFRTRSDTEVLVHAYDHWGSACVERFNGMWAFALWDARKRELFCSRDRLGIKPFYYFWDGSNLAFASEIKALLASGLVEACVNPAGLRQYLTFQFCLAETTLFEGIQKLSPGHNLTIQPGHPPKIHRYWDVEYQDEGATEDAPYLEELEELLT